MGITHRLKGTVGDIAATTRTKARTSGNDHDIAALHEFQSLRIETAIFLHGRHTRRLAVVDYDNGKRTIAAWRIDASSKFGREKATPLRDFDHFIPHIS